LQFTENKARNDQRAAEKAGCAKIRDAAIDDNVCVDYKRLVLCRLACEPHIGNDERELIPIAAHREHHAEVAEGAINHEPRRPLHQLRLKAQHLGCHQQVCEEEPEQQTERGGGKRAQRESF
jgi:hypothetical protein